MRIIGLGHYSRTGKDTLANEILLHLAFRSDIRGKKVSFAEKLKDICHQLYAWDGLREAAFYDTAEGAPFRDVKLPTVRMTPVELWVAVGTPAIRDHVYQNTWVDYVLHADHQCDVLIIPDVRFPNEVQAIREVGGTLIKVIREGQGPRNTVADRALHNWKGWDFIAGPTLDDLSAQAEYIANCLPNGKIEQSSSEQIKILDTEYYATRPLFK